MSLPELCNKCGDELLTWAENEDGLCDECTSEEGLDECDHCGNKFNDFDGDRICDECLFAEDEAENDDDN